MSSPMENINEAIETLSSLESELREDALDEIAEFIEETEQSASELYEQFHPKIQPMINNGLGEEEGDAVFGRAFAVLVYAGIVEKDCEDASLNDIQRQSIINIAAGHLDSEVDFRGFTNEANGWAHSIAHVSDLYGELFKSAHFTSAQAEKLKTAIVEFYKRPHPTLLTHNEDERLALAIVRATYSQRFEADSFYDFLATLLNKDDEDHPWYQKAFRDYRQLNRVNNIKSLMRAMYFQIKFHDEVTDKESKLAGIEDVLRELDEGFYNFAE